PADPGGARRPGDGPLEVGGSLAASGRPDRADRFSPPRPAHLARAVRPGTFRNPQSAIRPPEPPKILVCRGDRTERSFPLVQAMQTFPSAAAPGVASASFRA